MILISVFCDSNLNMHEKHLKGKNRNALPSAHLWRDHLVFLIRLKWYRDIFMIRLGVVVLWET
jgi:hypothetical protein